MLVYNDVFTDGLTMNEVARCLREQGGAAAVCGVTLARSRSAGAERPAWRPHAPIRIPWLLTPQAGSAAARRRPR